MCASAILMSFLLLMLGGCSDSGSYGYEAPAPGTGYDFDALASTLDGFVGDDENEVSGYSFVLDIGGTTVFQRAAGEFSTGSVVPIASSAKAPAAAAILALVDEGLIDLAAPVSRYLNGAVVWPLSKSAITMGMLLNHTSGIPFNSPCLSRQEMTLQACVQEIADTQLDFLPGTMFGYSGAGYQVAGLVAQQVTGQSWAAVIRERVTAPLGMSSYSYGNTQNPRVAGGAVSSAGDYLRFARMMLDGGTYGGRTVLSPAQAAKIRTSQIGVLGSFFSPLPPGAGVDGYSFGWWISDVAGLGGSIGPEVSDPGLLGTTPWIEFGRNYAAVLLVDSNTANGLAMWKAARARIQEQIAAHP
ncbi:hypothetical protein B1810_02345 [Panacagrimonas perspica]|nr:hypothetical protein B1810_02345 [Panacagrimonas perspica]